MAEPARIAFPAPAPDEAICLVGDLHGRRDCLELFLTLRERHFPAARMVMLGDMIDRGPDSRGVLDLLREASAEGAICLLGNHEEMLLKALSEPAENLPRWLRHGGVQTAEGFGLAEHELTVPEPEAVAQTLRERIGARVLDWMGGLPLYFRSGNVVAVHAGLDPSQPLSCQVERTMLWGHPSFAQTPRRDGLWVVHGHTIVDRAVKKTGRIALDTGAYATGRLSYALIDPALPEEERVMIGFTHSQNGPGRS